MLVSRGLPLVTGVWTGVPAYAVREVMLRDVVLPPEYAKGLEGLLLKEQQNERMVYDLQIKEKEVKQAELEAEADKAHRIRVTAAADSERLKLESDVLRENPLLIQKIVAERLSDKMQIMMVPMDGTNFFANEVFRGAALPLASSAAAPARAEGERKVARR